MPPNSDLFAGGLRLFGGFYRGIYFFAVTHDHGVQLLLDFPQNARRIDAWEIPVDMLIDDFHEGKQLG